MDKNTFIGALIIVIIWIIASIFHTIAVEKNVYKDFKIIRDEIMELKRKIYDLHEIIQQ